MVKKIFTSVLALLLAFHLATYAQTTEFTYQGNLNNGSLSANGSHDFEFLLFDTLSGGSQIGGVVALNGVAVTDGLFSVRLNFGSQFPGANRYLEI